MVVASPALRELDLERHGLEWAWPEVDLAHPLDDGGAAAMVRSIEETAAGLGAGRPRLEARSSARPRAGFDALAEDILRPLLHLPAPPAAAGPLRAAGGAAGDRARPRRSGRAQARALFGGVAAHAFSPLRPAASARRSGWR